VYKIGESIVIPETKQIKVIEEIEVYDNDVVIYTTDGHGYGIAQCKSVLDAYTEEVNKVVNKFKI
jgi:hypothetical protein